MIRAGQPEPAGPAMQSSLNAAGNAASLDCATGGSARRPQPDVARRDIPKPADLALPCASALPLLVDGVTTVTNAPHGRAGACPAAPRQAMAGRGRAADHGLNHFCRDRKRPIHAHASAADRHQCPVLASCTGLAGFLGETLLTCGQVPISPQGFSVSVDPDGLAALLPAHVALGPGISGSIGRSIPV